MIPKDFDVEIIAQVADASVFAARRSDVWHFILAKKSQVAPNYQSIDISQFHWPRYIVARALAALDEPGGSTPAQRLGFSKDGGGLLVSLMGNEYRLPAKVVVDLQKDIPVLEKALGSVNATGDGFEVPRAVTSLGHPVVAEQLCLAEAISFEKETRKKLDPRKFGVYSAFCTWRDFIWDDASKKEEIAAGIAEEMADWDPENYGDDAYWDSVFEIQERLCGMRIWGPGVEANINVINASLRGLFRQLSSIEFAQFVLMNGMHSGGPFHALAVLLGLTDFDDYKFWRTKGLQPDSALEQEIRTHTAFIELLGVQD